VQQHELLWERREGRVVCGEAEDEAIFGKKAPRLRSRTSTERPRGAAHAVDLVK